MGQQMKRVMGGIKEGILKLDLFDSGSLLRVKGEPEHKTLLGGMVSLSVMLVLVAAFYHRIIDTFDKVLITSSSATANAYDPPALNLTTIGTGPFMLGAEVFGHNLNEGSRYFDVLLISYQYIYGIPINATEISLEPCTTDHWSGYPEIQAKFQPLNMGYWKCLPTNSDFQIKGKYSSQESKALSIEVRVCSNNTLESRPCAPQAQIDQFFEDSGINFFTVYFINPLINPDSQDYLTYYLEDVNYMSFSSDYGGEGLLFVDDYTISTDNSMLPVSSIETESGGIFTTSAIKNTYIHNNATYASFVFYKSSTSINISRSYQKLDNVFSYIGGLFGTVLVFFFLVSSYNTYKFEVNLAGYLYRAERAAEGRIEKEYNFVYFVGQGVLTLLRLLGWRPQWERLGRYYRTREEMLKQLDVLFLIKRLNFLEKSLTFLFTPPQLKALHLTHQLTMADAVTTRRNYQLKAKLQREIQQREKLNNSPSSPSKPSPCKNDSSNQFIVQGNTSLKPTFDIQESSAHHFHLDSDDYSSDDESSEQYQTGETSLLSEISELHKDRENQMSRNIWQGIDPRLRQIIERSSSQWRFKDEMSVAEDRQNQFQVLRPEAISFDSLVLDRVSEHDRSEEMEGNAEENFDLTKVMFSRLRTVKVEKEDCLMKDESVQERE